MFDNSKFCLLGSNKLPHHIGAAIKPALRERQTIWTSENGFAKRACGAAW